MINILLILFCLIMPSFQIYAQDISEPKKLINMINDERKKSGLYLYKTTSELENIANIRAEEISKLFESIRPDGRESYTIYADNGISVAYVGESIKTGYETANAIFDFMIKDNKDFSSMLDIDYTHISVGMYQNKENVYWAILYCSLLE